MTAHVDRLDVDDRRIQSQYRGGVPRQCERPGCTAAAAVAYGMDGGQLLVWLELVPDDGQPARMGVVCRRHADAMVVPRGWTLDDRRESRPRLFRVSESTPSTRPRAARRSRRNAVDVAGPGGGPPGTDPPEQLSLSMTGSASTEPPAHPRPEDGPGNQPDDQPDGQGQDQFDDEVTVGEIRPLGGIDPNETQAIPWRFEYDERDDLGGVLKADSPLLSRAFGGPRRPG